MKLPFFTIGHSNRSLEEFIEQLTGAHINLVADIRTVPRSRTNPQFNEDTLPDALVTLDICYEHMAALGGLRGKTQTLPQDVNGFWTNESFHNYADYTLSAQFVRTWRRRWAPCSVHRICSLLRNRLLKTCWGFLA